MLLIFTRRTGDHKGYFLVLNVDFDQQGTPACEHIGKEQVL
jgi:hypothetical protein